MLLRTGDGSSAYALVYMHASKLGDAIVGGDFSKFVRNVRDGPPCASERALTAFAAAQVLDCSGAALPVLFLHGRLKYFRDLATRQKRAFRAEVQGNASASASQTAEAMTPDIFQSHLFTLQTFGVRIAECEKDDEVLREFDAYVKSVAFKPHRYAFVGVERVAALNAHFLCKENGSGARL